MLHNIMLVLFELIIWRYITFCYVVLVCLIIISCYINLSY